MRAAGARGGPGRLAPALPARSARRGRRATLDLLAAVAQSPMQAFWGASVGRRPLDHRPPPPLHPSLATLGLASLAAATLALHPSPAFAKPAATPGQGDALQAASATATKVVRTKSPLAGTAVASAPPPAAKVAAFKPASAAKKVAKAAAPKQGAPPTTRKFASNAIKLTAGGATKGASQGIVVRAGSPVSLAAPAPKLGGKVVVAKAAKAAKPAAKAAAAATAAAVVAEPAAIVPVSTVKPVRNYLKPAPPRPAPAPKTPGAPSSFSFSLGGDAGEAGLVLAAELAGAAVASSVVGGITSRKAAA